MLKVYNQPINKLKRIVFDVSQKTEELAVRQQDANLLHAAFVLFVKAEKANATELQELVKTANETEKREKAVKADLDASYERLATASEKADNADETEQLEFAAEKIESAFEAVSEEARGVPAIYERASALSRNRESLDKCMSRLYSLAHENPDDTYDDFTYKHILQACTAYANANAPIATRDYSMLPYMQLDMQLAALADALATLETLDKPIMDPTFTDLCVPP
jgi:hypothetical protein